jgi:hypothetical protein
MNTAHCRVEPHHEACWHLSTPGALLISILTAGVLAPIRRIIAVTILCFIHIPNLRPGHRGWPNREDHLLAGSEGGLATSQPTRADGRSDRHASTLNASVLIDLRWSAVNTMKG